MGAFEDFVNRELPRRSPLLTKALTGHDDSPKNSPPAIIASAPLGTWFYEETADRWWRRDETDWLITLEAGGAPSPTTQEDFTITMDPVGGSDPARPIKLTSQADADANGSFKTMPAVIASLNGTLIVHEVTIEFPDGTFTLDDEFLGDTEGIEFGMALKTGFSPLGGAIILTSANNLIRETATTAMAVAAATADQVILGSDPGFSVDQHARKYLRVVSGTGAGQVKAIRTHTTVTFDMAGLFSPVLDATSVVEVVRAAATLSTSLDFAMLGTEITSNAYRGFIFDAIDLVSTAAFPGFQAKGNIEFRGGARVRRMALFTGGTNLLLKTMVWDLEDNFFDVITLQSGIIRSSGNADAFYIHGSSNPGSHGIEVSGGAGGFASAAGTVALFLFGCFIDNCGGDAINAKFYSLCNLANPNAIRVSGITGYGINLSKGARCEVDVGDYFPAVTGEELVGGTGEILLDGVAKTWANVNAAPGNVIVGATGAIVDGNNP
jgi:hypothetical protein